MNKQLEKLIEDARRLFKGDFGDEAEYYITIAFKAGAEAIEALQKEVEELKKGKESGVVDIYFCNNPPCYAPDRGGRCGGVHHDQGGGGGSGGVPNTGGCYGINPERKTLRKIL